MRVSARAYLNQCLDVGVDGGVESGKGIVARDIRIAVLLNIVFVVLLANGIDSGENVDDTHTVTVLESNTDL